MKLVFVDFTHQQSYIGASSAEQTDDIGHSCETWVVHETYATISFSARMPSVDTTSSYFDLNDRDSQ